MVLLDRTEKSLTLAFFSTGRPHNALQTQCINTLVAYLGNNGIKAETLGRSLWSVEKPLIPIRKKISLSHGAVIVAMERFCSRSGIYKRGSEDRKVTGRQYFPSVWVQVEGAMAYQLGLPLLILKDKRLVSEGIVDSSIHEWIVIEFDHRKPSQLLETPRRDYIYSWINLVRSHRLRNAKRGDKGNKS